jgi:UDPglucose 6-dehydrogenase
MLEAGATIEAYDAEASANFKALVPEVTIVDDMYGAAQQADALVICTEWAEFSTPHFQQLKHEMKSPVIFDGRNIYSQDMMKKHGFHYYSVGRPTIIPSKEKV